MEAVQPSEKELHKNLVKLLRQLQNSHDFLFFHIKNDVGMRRNNFFYDLKSLGVLPGVADFCIMTSDSIVFLEIKTKKGKLSPKQKVFLKDVKRLGHQAFVAYGWDDILEKTKKIIKIGEEYGLGRTA